MIFKKLYEQLDRMVELINYNDGSYLNKEENFFDLYEGLIKTIPLSSAKIMLNRSLRSIGIPDKFGPNLQYDTAELRQDDTLTVNVLIFGRRVEKMKQFFNYINNFRYIISGIYYKKKSGEDDTIKFDENILFGFMNNVDQFDFLFINLEAKFDILLDKDKWPDKLYHLTRQNVLEKIKKIGITPRTHSKLSAHSERVYFAKDEDSAEVIYNQFKKLYPDQKFALLEIDPKQVKHLRLFDDPNFKNLGCYGLVNVPPNAIKIFKENI